jgi:hypothetical protein
VVFLEGHVDLGIGGGRVQTLHNSSNFTREFAHP